MKKEKPKMYIASCSFGKDSIATILLALEHNEPLDRVVFSEVMFDHEKNISGEIPEHIEWVYKVAIPKLESMGVKVDVVRAKESISSLSKKVYRNGKRKGNMRGLPSGKFCWANGALKIKAVRDYCKELSKEKNIIHYIGIAIDEPKRLKRFDTQKVSLLTKYGYTEEMAMAKCVEYGLVSPLYSMGYRGGVLVLLQCKH